MSQRRRSRTPAILQIFAGALKAWWDDDALRLGASLAYYTLFAIAPVLLVAIGIAGLVFNTDTVRGEIVNQLDHLVGREGARAVQSLLDGASQRRAGIVATAIGSVAFVIAATGAFLELQAALNTVWRVKSNPGAHLKAFLIDRLRSFGLVVAIGFLLMVSLAVTAALAAFSAWISPHSSSVPMVWSGVQFLVSLIGTTALFALLYRILPDVHLGWRDVTIGAFVTAVLFTLGQQLIGLYLGQSSMATSYGAAGSVMILLLWVYYSCQILLLGAEFTRVHAEHRGTTFEPHVFAEHVQRTQSGGAGSRLDVIQRRDALKKQLIRVRDGALGGQKTAAPDVHGSLHSVTIIARIIMRRTPSPPFDVDGFLRSAGTGRPAVTYRAAHVIFSQGDAADTVVYIQKGAVKLSVLSDTGREAVVGMLGPGDFFGEHALTGHPVRLETATTVTATTVLASPKQQMVRLLHEEHTFSDRFIAYMLARNMRIEADLIDQLFNASEKRLARALLLLAHYGKPEDTHRVLPRISQETLAEMIGTTRSRVNFFMNRFKKLGFIEYNGGIKINQSLLTVVLHD